MKTALKLSKKELFSLYEKSSTQVKMGLEAEFGKTFFMKETEKTQVMPVVFKDRNAKTYSRKFKMDWEAFFDFTPALRMIGYAVLFSIIFL